MNTVTNPQHTEHVEQVGLSAYRKDYARGWKAGNSGATSRIWESASGSVAWDAGFLDARTGRERWHTPSCQQHDTCP